MSRLVNLNSCFPKDKDGNQGPLPKQAQFIEAALDPQKSKYIAYIGGVGSGKTVVGCTTIISWAVLHGGDYLIGRQFYPELRDTTMKAFFEACPIELILEHRVADNLVKLRAANNQIATIFFRPMDEPDKMRSMNLSGFYLDEANQVSEEAFLLLQGRLRNQKGLRKGILTSNPKGHDYLYRWFVKKDHFKDDKIKKEFMLVHAPSTENIHLPTGYVESMMSSWSEDRVQREIMASFDSFEGAVYPEFRRDVHVIRPFSVPDGWTKIIGIDHGYRNPAAWVWMATDYDGNHYVYREFYQKEWLIDEICKRGKEGKRSAHGMMPREEKIQAAYIDPSTGNRKGSDGRSDLDWYLDSLPKGFPIIKANNAVAAGIDRTKTLFKPDKNGKPRLYIFSTCVNLAEELSNYRYEELRPGQSGTKNDKEQPLKVNDHAVDALRYAIMALPESDKGVDEIYKKIKYQSIEGALHRDLEKLRKPNKSDPFGDY